MPDIAGAIAAIETRMTDNWTTTAVQFENSKFNGALDATGKPQPWVRFTVENEQSEIIGVGKPGAHMNTDSGAIAVMVFVPVNTGRALAYQYASAIGEIFRVKEFYRSEGFCVRTWKPFVGRPLTAQSQNPEGNWFCVTVTIPFEFISIA